MKKRLNGKSLAVLVANGFNEAELVGIQRAVQEEGGKVSIVSMEKGLVHGWRGDEWGLNFIADQVLSASLAADFSMIFIPGGARSIDKLKLTGHTGRFLKGFMDAGKPALLAGEAVELLVFCACAAGRRIAGPARFKETVETGGGIWEDAERVADGALMTCGALAVEEALEFLAGSRALAEAA